MSNTIDKYLENMPDNYLLTELYQAVTITNYMNKYFSSDWGKFEVDYIWNSRSDRLAYKENGQVCCHVRIFDRDLPDVKIMALGGLFKVDGFDGNVIKKCFSEILDHLKPDVNLVLSSPSNAKMIEFFKNEYGFKYGTTFKENKNEHILYQCVNDFAINEDIINRLSNLERY